jgi:hypothetical protein
LVDLQINYASFFLIMGDANKLGLMRFDPK